MFRTYIYGTPKGFDMYEEDKAFENYAKGFYISSNKGKRLVVSRRSNGDTIYSFLHYRLTECEGRPKSFFGMSIVIENSSYVNDFCKIYEWCEYLFNKLLENDKALFVEKSLEEDRQIIYTVPRFKEKSNVVEWLKSNLPNIFSNQGGVSFSRYDASFSDNNFGQIATLNIAESQDVMLNAFREYNTIAISPEFKMLKTQTQEDKDTNIELDFTLLDTTRDEINQQLVPIAINATSEDARQLRKWKSSVDAMSVSIHKFLNGEISKEAKDNSNELMLKLQVLASSIDSLLNKISTETVNHQFKYCPDCKQTKELKFFTSPISEKCIECELKSTPYRKRCKKCGRLFPAIEFPKDSDLCERCSKSNEFNIKKIAVVAAGIALGILIFVLISVLKKDDIEKTPDKTPTSRTLVPTGVSRSNNVVKEEYESYISQHNYGEAYSCIKHKDDKALYITSLKESIDTYLWGLFDLPIDQAEESMINFLYGNSTMCSELSIDQDEWLERLEKYKYVNNLLKKNTITDDEFSTATKKLEDFPEDFRTANLSFLKTKIKKAPIPPSPKIKDNTPLYIIVTDKTDTKIVREKEQITRNRGITIFLNEYVLFEGVDTQQFKCNNPNDKGVKFTVNPNPQAGTYKMQFKEDGNYVFTYNDIQVTIIVKKMTRR